MRLFVALEIPQEIREAVAGFQKQWQAVCKSARWVRMDAMHMTLKFIGEVPAENLSPIRDVLGSMRSDEPVELHFRGLGFFPNEKRPRVLWCGVEASANTIALAADIDRALIPLGIPAETRAFAPHLTLARFNSHDLHDRGRQPDGLTQIVNAVRASAAASLGSTRATEFHLFESKLRATGAEYSVIATFPFVEAAR